MAAGSSFGTYFKVHSFGESHGPAMGVVIDGCPAGVDFQPQALQSWLERRRPGAHSAVTDRREGDQPEVLSGVFEGKTLGTPIAVMIRNTNQRSGDYQRELVRQGHADDTWQDKFGIRDHRGGGRASGRETVSRVIAAAFAQMLVQQICPAVRVQSKAKQIGPLTVDGDPLKDDRVVSLLEKAKQEGESFGGIVEASIEGLPSGLGQPVFHKFKSDLTSGLISIGATLGVEFGAGFTAGSAKGTAFHSNQTPYGGVRGGITTGEPVIARVVFKPTASILDVAKKGRHDPCIVPRAMPVVEAMCWFVVADQLLASRLDRAF